MGIQDKIAKSQITAQHKLRDYKVDQNGFEGQIIRLKTEENRYGDENIQIVNDDVITLSLDLPDEIPYSRMRTDVTKEVAKTQSLYLYDVLPIEGFAKYDDNVEKGDLLIHKIYDNREDGIPFYLVLRVSEILGTISLRYISSRKFYCSPHNMALPQRVQDIINKYKEV